MGQPAKKAVEIRDFAGLVTRADPDDVPPGAAQDQVNLSSARAGELVTRSGARPVIFEEE